MDKQLLETTTSNIFITLMIVLFALAFLAPLFKQKKVRREIESITKKENHVDVLSALMFQAQNIDRYPNQKYKDIYCKLISIQATHLGML